jgi:hypothetical protein
MALGRRMLLFGAVALPLGCRKAQAAAVGGWQAARWEMDGKALDAAFPGAIRRIDPPLHFGPWVAERLVDNVRVGGRRFQALLQHPQGQDRLRQVLLRFNGGTPMPADYAAVKRALIAELGAPLSREAESDYVASFPSFGVAARWRLPGTTVTLRYVDPNAERIRVRKSLTLRYSATS